MAVASCAGPRWHARRPKPHDLEGCRTALDRAGRLGCGSLRSPARAGLDMVLVRHFFDRRDPDLQESGVRGESSHGSKRGITCADPAALATGPYAGIDRPRALFQFSCLSPLRSRDDHACDECKHRGRKIHQRHDLLVHMARDEPASGRLLALGDASCLLLLGAVLLGLGRKGRRLSRRMGDHAGSGPARRADLGGLLPAGPELRRPASLGRIGRILCHMGREPRGRSPSLSSIQLRLRTLGGT